MKKITGFMRNVTFIAILIMPGSIKALFVVNLFIRMCVAMSRRDLVQQHGSA